ncbi:hypothetical protein [Rathayibacter sp. VKM Ac-2927]|nr:hypothetical protein [Rathayibacter sp. VKM Ac-2927]MCJ1686205.1 hypothetical protein [Rathayibacter sp. VKM Ac-2927]
MRRDDEPRKVQPMQVQASDEHPRLSEAELRARVTDEPTGRHAAQRRL